MAQGLFTLKQVNQAVRQGAWFNSQPTYYGSFNGSNQSIYASANSLNIRTTSFTIEGYFYANTLYQNGGLFGATTPSFYVQINNAGRIFVSDGATDTITVLYGSAFQPQTWTHIALSFDGTTYRLFFNGVLLSSSTTLLANNTLTNLYVGLSPSNGLYFNGLISNFRFVKGTALYTANFAPPTGPLTAVANTSLLTLQNATIVDNSTNAFTITNNNSVTTTQSNLVFGSSNKTSAVEYLVVAGGGGGGGYYGSGGGGGGLLQGNVPVAAGSALTVTVGAGGTGTSNGYGNNGSSSVFGSISTSGGGGGAGGSTSSAKNGNAGGSGGGGQGFGSTPPGLGGACVLGQGNAGGAANGSGGGCGGGAGTVGLNSLGYVGRGGDGIATAISGTLTAYAGGGAGAGIANSFGGVGGGGNANTAGTVNTGGGAGGDDAKSGGSGIVIVSYPDVYAPPTALTGTFTVSTSGSGSILNTSSSCVTYPNNTAFDFGSGNFTIEGWVYSTVASGEQYLFSKRASATYTPIEFGLIASGASNRIYFLGSTSGSNWEINSSFSTGSISIPINTWVHIALVRNGNVYTSYVNGVADLTVTVSGALMTNTSAVSIGASVIDGSNAVIGYFSNVRVVKGTAVYTTAFTPSVTPLTAISGSSLLMSAVSGSFYTDGSPNSFTPTKVGTNSWNSASPFSVTGYKNRVYTWTSSGSITF